MQLGDLARGRVFYRLGTSQRFAVSRNLGVAGVSVLPLATREVRVGGRTFTARQGGTEVWSAASPVEVETRDRAATEEEAENV